MTVIRPNSVSGINSITAQADEIKVFKSNGTQGGLIIGGANLNATTGISTILALNVTGNVSIAGTLTYQDVTNVDSIGIITARAGVNVSAGQLDVGSNIKIGNAGVITATSFVGNISGGTVSGSTGTFTGDVSIVDKIVHTGDTDTLIKFPANDTISFETAGTERLRITSAGRVGIDRTSPSTMLDIKVPPLDTATITTTNCLQLGMLLTSGGTGSNTDGHIYNGLAVGDGYAGLYGKDGGSSAATDLEFFTGSASAVAGRMRIQDDGKIIIGGNVSQSINRNVSIVAPTGNSQDIVIGLQPTNSSGGYNPEAYIGATADGTYGAAMYFYTRDTSGTRAERLRITSTGQLLVNTTSALHSDVRLQSNSAGGYNIVAKSTNGNGGFQNFTGLASNDTITSYITHNGRGYFEDGVQFDSSGEVLNSYETGVWVPEVIDANGSNYSITYTANETRYVRIGNLVYCYYNIRNQEGGSKTGDLRLRGWPFTCKGFQINGAYWVDHSSPSAGLGDIVGGTHYINHVSGNNVVYWVKPTDKSGSGQASTRYLQHGQWTNGRWIYGSFVYEVT